MAPNPLTPIAEEQLSPPQFPTPVHETSELDVNANVKEDRGCVFFYDKPQLKGNFYDDSFFRNAQKNYEEAVKQFLSSSEIDSIFPQSSSDMMSSLRERNQLAETQVYGLTELEDIYQIVVDVKGYSAGDISVKAVGDLELIVEAKKCETTPDGKSVTSSFSRRFELPGYVRLDAVSSALSKDGILTVSAPKLNPAPAPVKSTFIQGSKSEPQQMNGNSLHGGFFDERQRMCDQGLSNMLSDLDLDSRNKFQSGFRTTDVARQSVPEMVPTKNMSSDVIEETDHYKIVLDTSGYTPNDISVKAVGDRELQIDGNHVEKSSTGSETSKNFSRRFCLPGLVKLEEITSSLSPDGRLTIRAPKKIDQSPQGSVLNQSHLHGVPVNNSIQQNSQNFSKVYATENVAQPTNTFDDFFSDDFGMGSMMPRRHNPESFMEKARSEYEESMRNMRNRHFALDTQPTGFFNDFPVMKTTEETSDVVESENDYKVKLDVSKYGPKDISVKAVGDRELLIEGKQTKKQAGGPAISQCFSRKFSLPGLVRFEAITSSLSPEGILTITAPKAV